MSTLAEWFDIRPGEERSVWLSVLGAFLVLAFMILARSLREALFLTSFPVSRLPYVIAAVAFLSLPAVSGFMLLLGRHRPRRVLAVTTLLVIAGLAALGPWIARPGVVVAFYIWTAVGTLLLTSGFWVATSELFAVRGAKRLFGLIGAGGTAGAWLAGVSLGRLTGLLSLPWLLALATGLLVLFYVVQLLAPRPRLVRQEAVVGEDRLTLPQRFRLIWETPYLRTVAGLVFCATVASTLLDFQFKDLARASTPGQGELAALLGAFYGWTGGAALLLQLTVASRLVGSTGVAMALSVLPLALLGGATAVFAVPTLLVAVLARGADNALRRSLFRPLVEFLYVPLPTALRRRTKTVVDSIIDSLAEGTGAALILLAVTLGGLSSRWLSPAVAALAAGLLLLSRSMGRRYFQAIARRLEEEDSDAADRAADAEGPRRDLLSAAFTRLDLQVAPTLAEEAPRVAARAGATPRAAAGSGDSLPERLRSPDERIARAALAEVKAGVADVDEDVLAQLTRLLARDELYERAVARLRDLGERPVPLLADLLRDPQADFVIRRRIPAVLAAAPTALADAALLDALSAERFEIRYRAAIALVRRRRRGLPRAAGGWRERVWQAIAAEVRRERPVWELQRLLDGFDDPDDELVIKHVGVRGSLSLEHTFRMLSLVLDPQLIQAAFHGIALADASHREYALEYLEHVLPDDIRRRLWTFIGDVSERQQRAGLRPLDKVASDLMTSQATLFAGQKERDALRRMLEERSD